MGDEVVGEEGIQKGAVVAHEDERRLNPVEDFQPDALGFINSANIGTVTVAENPGEKITVCRAVTPGTDHRGSAPGCSIGE